jgi:hypothetical protein
VKKIAYVFLPLAVMALISVAFIAGKKYTAGSGSRSSYTITKETAHNYVAAFQHREEAQGKKRGEYVRSFSISATEVQDIMKALTTISNGEISKMKVRFYKGINDEGKETLVIVAVDSNGKDVTYYKDKDGNLQSGIFDFTKPCPDTCDGDDDL